MSKLAQIITSLMLSLVMTASLRAYVQSTHQSVWTPGPIPMKIMLGSSTPLADGTNHTSSVQGAMQTWNGYLGTVQFVAQVAVQSATQTDGINDVYFDSTIEGGAFGTGVLAVTLLYGDTSIFELLETDIIFNTAWTWDSYRGNLQEVEDIRRVALHELGHVLGLTHPDQFGQSVSAQMNSTVSNLDTLTSDDIAGAQSIYRAPGQTYAPGNDNFHAAVAISLPSGSTQVSGTNLYATKEAGEPDHDPGTGTGGASVWWKWTASATGSATIHTQGSKFDTLLGVYTGSTVGGLTLVGGNDDAQPGVLRYSILSFSAVAGVTYYFAVDGWGGISGPVVLNLNFTVTDIPPSVTSHPSSRSVYAGDAVEFSASGSGLPAPSYRWQHLAPGGSTWVDTSGYGVFTNTFSISPVSLSHNGYQYRCIVSNRSGSVPTNAAMLTVSPLPPPTITTQPASQLAISDGAVRFGVVATRAASYQWQILTSSGGWENLINSAAYRGQTEAALTVNIGVAALAAGTQFRCIVSNATGSVASEVVTFAMNHARVVAVSAGETYSVLLKNDGTLWIAGSIGAFSYQRPGLLMVDVIQASAGYGHMLFLKTDGTLWGLGNNGYGELGVGGGNYYNTPVQISTTVRKASAGRNSSLFIKTDGSLWGMGRMTGPNSGLKSSLSPISIASGVLEAVVGESTNFFIKSDGTMWGWGENSYGQLGNGSTGGILNPEQIATGVTTIATCGTHSLFVKNDGTLWAMGRNESGNLGDGTSTTRLTPVQVAMGVAKVYAGFGHNLYLKTDGTLWGMGANFAGQLGSGSVDPIYSQVMMDGGVVEAAASPAYYGHNIYLKADGTVWAVGDNGQYKLGDGSSTRRVSPVYITGNFAPVITSLPENLTTALGTTAYFQVVATGAPAPTYQWQRLPAGGGVWGNMANGGSYSGVTTASLAVTDLTLAMNGDQFRCVVTNSVGTVTSAGATLSVFVPLPVIVTQPVGREVAVGATIQLGVTVTSPVALSYQWQKDNADIEGATASNYSIASAEVSDAGDFKVIVTNSAGSVISQTVAVTVASGPPVINAPPLSQTVTGGDTVTFSVTASSNVTPKYQWKKGGDPIAGATQSVYSKANAQFADAGAYTVVVSNAAGSVTSGSALLTVEGAVPAITSQPQAQSTLVGMAVAFNVAASGRPVPTYQWQRLPVGGAWTNLVDGGVYSGTTNPTLRIAAAALGMNGERFRCVATNALGMATSDAATLNVAVAGFGKLSVGRYHSLRLNAAAQLYVTGVNAQGQLGTGNTTNVTVAQRLALDGQTVSDIAAGAQHSLFLTSANEVWATGLNSTGQLGDGTNVAKSTPIKIATNAVAIAAGNFHSAILKADGTLWTVGGNDSGQLGRGTITDTTTLAQIASDVIDVAAGIRQTLFIKSDGTLWGMGDMNGSGVAVTTPLQIASQVKAVAAGGYHSLFVKTDGTLWTMGYNPYGQLGNGTATTSNTPAQVASGVKRVTAGYFYSAFIKTDESLWLMGYNSAGQLGNGTQTNALTPFQLVAGAVAVSAGEGCTVFTSFGGSLNGAGYNAYGQFGNGTTESSTIPVEIENGSFIKPAVPVGLVASVVATHDRVHLSWQPAADAISYEVWRGTYVDAGAPDRIAADLRWPIYQDRSASGGTDYYYWVRAINPAGVSAFSAAVVGSADGMDAHAPFILTPPQSETVNAGGNVSLTVGVSGTSPFTYQWRKNGENIVGATNPAYWINDAVTEDAGSYDVIVGNAVGSVTSDPAVVTVNLLAQAITFGALADRPYTAMPITLVATASSELPVSFSVISGPATVVGASLTLSGAGEVRVQASQVGNDFYAAATPVERIFTVTANFGTWRLDHFAPEERMETTISGLGADPDGDGVVNLLEYALGMDPRGASVSGLPEVSMVGTDWVYTYSKPAGISDVTYVVERTGDLSIWTTDGVTVEWVSTTNGVETWRATYSAGATATVFFRLSVTL